MTTGEEENNNIEIDSELDITLSLIESGCLATSHNNRTIFIYKGAREMIDSTEEIDRVSFDFNCIKRPEFPSVAMYFYLLNRQNKIRKFEYFFGIDSEQEMELLGLLENQDHFEIYFVDTSLKSSIRVPIGKDDKIKIRSVIDEARR